MSNKPKTMAESAYCDLLAMPLPKTALDFRRAIVMAVMIGRQLEAECPNVGTHPVDTYHYGLIDTRRRRANDTFSVAPTREEVLELRISEGYLRAALQLIAAPQRADGTWNRDREACRQLAREALDGADPVEAVAP